MKKKFSFGVKQLTKSAPIWAQKLMGLCAVLLVSKEIIIDGLPGLTPEHKILAGSWWSWGINFLNLLAAAIMALSGKKEVSKVEIEEL